MTLEYITLQMQPSAQQQAALNRLLAEQQDPSSHNFHCPGGARSELVLLQRQCSTGRKRLSDVPEALLAKGKLELAGIECLLADGNLVRMDSLLSNAIGSIRLQVRQQDLESARALLDEQIPAEFGEEEVGEPLAQPRCPRCYSLDIGFEKIDRFWT